MLRQCINQPRHHRQVNHRSFIHHQHIQMQWIASVITQPLATGQRPQKTMQGTGFIRQRRLLFVSQRQLAKRRSQRFRQASGCFSGWCGKTNATACAISHLHQRGKQLRHRRGFPGARAARDHRYAAGKRNRRCHLLPVNVIRRLKQVVQRLPQTVFIYLQRLINPGKKVGNTAFVAPHTVQIQSLTHEDHRRCHLPLTHRRRGQ